MQSCSIFFPPVQHHCQQWHFQVWRWVLFYVLPPHNGCKPLCWFSPCLNLDLWNFIIIDEWGPLVLAASISSGVQSCPTDTGHLTRAYLSNKYSAGCRLTLHIANTRPCKFPSMTPSGRVNFFSNHRWSSSNAVSDLFSHQCHRTLSRFGVGCTAAANMLDSQFLLRLAPDWECTSDSRIKFSAINCGWLVWIKSIGLACVVDCAIVLRISLLTFLVLR